MKKFHKVENTITDQKQIKFQIGPIEDNFKVLYNRIFNGDKPINDEVDDYQENEDGSNLEKNIISFSPIVGFEQISQNYERSKSVTLIKSNYDLLRKSSKWKSSIVLKKINLF